LSNKKSSNVKEALKLVAIIAIVVGIVIGVNIGLQVAMGTPIPIVVVSSGSMEPTLYRGDVCFVQRVATSQYVVGNHYARTGDIIVFDATGIYAGSDPIIHRIVNKTYDPVTNHTWFLTQGDHNMLPDNYMHGSFPSGWVEDTKVYGKVVLTIPWIGNIFLFLREGGYWILVLALAVIIVYVFISETSKIDKKVKEKMEPNSGNAPSYLAV
jgi:signal peptidase